MKSIAAGITLGVIIGGGISYWGQGNIRALREDALRILYTDVIGLHARERSRHLRTLVKDYLTLPQSDSRSWRDKMALLLFVYRSALEQKNLSDAEYFLSEAERICSEEGDASDCVKARKAFESCKAEVQEKASE